MTHPRAPYLKNLRSVVIKLGTQLLSDKNRRLDVAYVNTIAAQVAALRERKINVTLVSSGAIGAGMALLGMSKRPTDLAKLQAVAAIGQRRLMDAWADAFESYSLPVAQLLLTRDDIEKRARYLNLRNTISAIHELGGVPIINENDPISTDEIIKITFGDNDILAALVAHALGSELLVLMTVVDGVLDQSGRPVRMVNSVDQARQLVRAEKSAMGKGGMESKIKAARLVTSAGQALVVVDGRMEQVLKRVVDGEELGTLFVPASRRASSRSRWIGSLRPVGSIVVDEGCVRALVEKNRSLLAAGVVRAEGTFKRGDVVAIIGPDGSQIARGLTNYAADTVAQVAGRKTAEVKALLKEAAYDEVIHRDNLVVG